MTLAVVIVAHRACSSSSSPAARGCSAGRRDAGASPRGAACRLRSRRAAACWRRAGLSRPVRAAVRGPHDLRRRHLHRRARDADRHARRRRSRSRSGARSPLRQRRRRRRASAGWSPPSCRRRVCYSVVGVVGWYVNELHRQAERAGAGAAVHRAQHRVDAAGLRARSRSPSSRSRPRPASKRRRRRTTRRRCRTSACGTGARCRTRCGRSRRSAPTTTSPTSTSIATRSTARCGR